MNEKIRQFADQAWDYASEHCRSDWNAEWHQSYDTKFAQLIVQECIMICKSHKIQSTEDVWYLAHNETVNNISENIEEYFGVAE